MNTEKTYIVPYNYRSKGAKALARALGIKVRRTDYYDRRGYYARRGSTGPDEVLINWGYGDCMDLPKGRVLNRGVAVKTVSNKTRFFRHMDQVEDGPRLPPWTLDPKVAAEWAKAGKVVLGREIVEGSGGRGIVFSEDDIQAFLSCKLWTEYVKSKGEYRIHIAFGEVIDKQKKGLPHDIDKANVDTRVRSHRNGFIFMRQDILVPEDVITQAKKAMAASGLDFGAVDVLYNQYYNKAYVLEINTAPGLEGTTIENYAKAFKEHLK